MATNAELLLLTGDPLNQARDLEVTICEGSRCLSGVHLGEVLKAFKRDLRSIAGRSERQQLPQR